MLATGAGIGVVVSLKVDYCTHFHAQGLLTIVYKVNENAGGILVAFSMESSLMTEQGVTTGFRITSIRLLQKWTKWYQFKQSFSRYRTWY